MDSEIKTGGDQTAPPREPEVKASITVEFYEDSSIQIRFQPKEIDALMVVGLLELAKAGYLRKRAELAAPKIIAPNSPPKGFRGYNPFRRPS